MNNNNIDLLQTGVATIDAQHRKLNDVMKRFTESSANGTLNEALIDEVIDSLGDYMVTHFDDEEFLMRSLKYPQDEFDLHVQAHEEGKNMWTGISSILEDAGESRGDILVDGVGMIYQWFLRHIAVHDKAICYYVKQQRAANAASKTRRLF